MRSIHVYHTTIIRQFFLLGEGGGGGDLPSNELNFQNVICELQLSLLSQLLFINAMYFFFNAIFKCVCVFFTVKQNMMWFKTVSSIIMIVLLP